MPQTPCDRLWHPEFLEVLLQDEPTWVWVPRLVICRQHQRSLGIHHRHSEGVLTCTDPNCTRAHAPDWHRAELLAFHWLVQHRRLNGLGVGYALNGSLLHMSKRQVRQILSDMPYVDEEFYHSFRWHRPIPAPRPYGDMIITATSRRANHNEQPRRRDTTPRRAHSQRRSPSRPRPRSPSPRQATWTRKAPPPATPVAEPYDPGLDPWATPTPDPEPTPAQMPTRPAPPELPTVITPSITPRRNKIPPQDPLEMAKETLSHYAPTTVEPIPRPVPPPARPINTNLSQAAPPPIWTQWPSHGKWYPGSLSLQHHPGSQTMWSICGSNGHQTPSPHCCLQHTPLDNTDSYDQIAHSEYTASSCMSSQIGFEHHVQICLYTLAPGDQSFRHP